MSGRYKETPAISVDKFTKSVTDLVVGHAVAGDSRKRNVILRFAAKIQARLESGTNMRKTLASCFFFSMLGLTALSAQNKTPPTKLVFEAKPGNITFDH